MRLTGRLRRGVFLLVAGVAITFAGGFVAFAVSVASARPPADPKAQGIVVLTGGSARIEGALHLLAEGRASRLLISGVNPSVGAQALAGTLDGNLNAMLVCCVDLGHEAHDTIGNATETRDWVTDHGYSSLIVVTSDYHMPRSLAELGSVLPGVNLVPYPVSNPELHLADWWSDPEAFGLLAREYGKYLLTATRLMVSPQTPSPAKLAGG